ncbi:MAG: 2Fe-2S iron-sulfur cluster binding domain-containing protein [Gammaproteobacteria bacterium]|nr:2Fe-2S iron-sulfur cluster binding domain-containing protein [Gammaproteobacteria bacterium]
MSANVCKVIVENNDATFECEKTELVLDEAIKHGIRLPHNCRGGACGTCKAQVLEGSVDHGWVMGFTITEEEKAEGKCLICQSRATSDVLKIRMLNPMPSASAGAAIEPQRFDAEVVSCVAVTPSVRRLVVAVPPEVDFRYESGMHMEIGTAGVSPHRTYSIATPADESGKPVSGLLEFYIVRHPGGASSGWIHEELCVGRHVTVHGPYGQFTLPSDIDDPMLLLAGGTGLAPILSILKNLLARGHEREAVLIFSVRDASEVFAQDELRALAHRYSHFRYLITLTRQDEMPPHAHWRKGRLQGFLAEEFPDLSGWWVLSAGSPTFVEACVVAVKAQGAYEERIFVDSFLPRVNH